MNQFQNLQNSKSPDVIVVGGGVFGLWAARHSIKRGERVLVLDKRHIGEGASGGFLGALMPHLPDFWEPKKEMQFCALRSMPDVIKALEEDTGLDCGYRRCGRLMPLTHEKMPENAARRISGAKEFWVDENGKQIFQFELIEPGLVGSVANGWLNEEMAPFGATYDDFSARINPRKYIEALASFVRSEAHGLGQIAESVEVRHVRSDPGHAGVSVTLKSGEILSAGKVVIANGWEAYPLLGKMSAVHQSRPITGRGVKGQAVLLDFPHDDALPIIYDNGSYIIPHAHGRVAVGSTSVDNWLPYGLNDADLPLKGKSVQNVQADHPERPVSVEPTQNRVGYDDGPLPEFTEVAAMSKEAMRTGNEMATESFAGGLSADDPLAQKLIAGLITRFDEGDMGFYEKALQLCPSIAQAPIIEKWSNIRPRNTVPHSITGKVSTEPLFGALDGEAQIKVAIGGFKISLGLAHLDSSA